MSKKLEKSDISTLRHSAAHLLAQALIELFPKTVLTIGPATKEGFFYDVLPEKNFREEDLIAITERMHDIVARDLPLTHEQMPKDQARKLYAGNKFKLELIDGIPGDTVGIARQGDFYDLCRGGHVASTGMLKHFKLTGISGSYWRADRNNQPLQRISGIIFFSAEDQAAAQKAQEEALKYDHRTLGKELDLFSLHEEGVGFPFFHPKGTRVFNKLISLMRQLHAEYGYEEIKTPTMLSDELWRRSGHYEHYRDKMYFSVIPDEDASHEKSYAIKPMNCPGSILVYQTRPHSYRELPLKLAEFGHVHRHELSGVLHGLTRVRAFTQDDAHIYCTPETLEENIGIILTIIKRILALFDLNDIRFAVSTRPESAMGNDALWTQATDALKNALKNAGLSFDIKEGEGAFYGPKIEVVIEDSFKRSWQCGTVQVDFFQPENFDLTYVASSGQRMRPVIIHQAIYGSLERFFAIILEHYKGNLPFWLAPLQARVLSITSAQSDYARTIGDALRKAGITIDIDDSADQISAKIKSAQIEKIPWMIVVGAKEAENKTVALRHRDGKQEFGLTIDELVSRAKQLSVV